MTEKRFTQKDEDDWEILDRNKHFAYAHSGYQAEKIILELNELVETNRELYKDNKQLKQGLNDDLKLIGQLQKENEQLKKVLGSILLEVKQDISNTNQTGEIKVFINPNSFDLISEVLRKYGALKEWHI